MYGAFSVKRFLIQVFNVSIPMFDQRSHPSVPTMIPARRRRGRRSRMAVRPPPQAARSVLEVRPRRRHARMLGRWSGLGCEWQVGWSKAELSRLVDRQRTTRSDNLVCGPAEAGDHDALCASEARLPGGWDHSLDRLGAHIGARYTTHLGHAGPPGLPVSRARVSPARGRNGQLRRP